MADNKVIEQGSADFDWEALANEGYSNAEKAEYAETYEATLTSINEKEVIKGTVVAITKKRSCCKHRVQV